ncbi:hypothetical protein B4113_3339 [Geobacillus sp. B4113_201601]|nr:hypothetical protein B4113_3339 [Geobacillus sp. B4113_201601]
MLFYCRRKFIRLAEPADRAFADACFVCDVLLRDAVFV